jgi:hypothetical protein
LGPVQLSIQLTPSLPGGRKRYENARLMDTSPTALFESYEQDFRQFIETIQEKLDDNGGDDKGCQNPQVSPPTLTFFNQKSVNLIYGEYKWN